MGKGGEGDSEGGGVFVQFWGRGNREALSSGSSQAIGRVINSYCKTFGDTRIDSETIAIGAVVVGATRAAVEFDSYGVATTCGDYTGAVCASGRSGGGVDAVGRGGDRMWLGQA